MPTYDYICERCGHRFERFQKMSDAPVKTCPECTGSVRRLISGGAAVIVKNPSAGGGASCDRTQPCCGRDVPCDRPPCRE